MDLQTICANHDSIRKELLKTDPTLNSRSLQNAQKCTESSSLETDKASDAVKSCDDTGSTSSGLFNLTVASFGPVVVFCEILKTGGWIVIQRRFDGSVDFYRNWTDYRNGFGSVDKEHWLGLEVIHQMTKQGGYELMIELETYDGNYTYAQYSEFAIGGESEQYALQTLSGYSGTAGDQLSPPYGIKFSTFDRDNDNYGYNCAESWKGAWWYNACSYT